MHAGFWGAVGATGGRFENWAGGVCLGGGGGGRGCRACAGGREDHSPGTFGVPVPCDAVEVSQQQPGERVVNSLLGGGGDPTT